MAKILTVDERLDVVDYDFVGYLPSRLALLFVGFIKEVNDGEEENETPVLHLVMMDSTFNKERRCAILVHRGAGKTTLFAEYLILFIASFGYFPGFGNVNLMLYITDSIENGVKNLRRNVEYRYENSVFLQKMIPHKKIGIGINGAAYVDIKDFEESAAEQTAKFGGHKFTDIRLEFQNVKGDRLVVKGYGAKALSLDSRLYTDNGYSTIRDVKIGDKISGADGILTNVIEKSEIFHKPMYKIELMDGRAIKVSEDHINSVVVKENPHNTSRYEKRDLTTNELLSMNLYLERNKGEYISRENLIFIENCKPLELSRKDFPISPYVLGLLLGDGSMKKDGSVALHAHKDDMKEYLPFLNEYKLGSYYIDKRNTNVVSQSIKGLSKKIRELGVNVHGNYKFVPDMYKYGSYVQRIEILQGLMDTDGTICKNGRMSFCSNSERLARDVMDLVRSIGGSANILQSGIAYKIEIKINSIIFMLKRKRQRYVDGRSRNMVGIRSIFRIEDEPSQCIAVDNYEHQFITDNYVRTHNTGVRGSKEMGQRPTVAIFDDLFSDKDAESTTIIADVENTVYKAVSKALHPTIQKMLWLGTPFNASDPLYKAVGSGKWNVSCYPICEHFDSLTTKEEFKGSWEDRFPYEYVKAEYEEAMALGRPSDFYQELMLRISSEEERLIPDSNLVWYSRDSIMNNLGAYNFYILTDLGASDDKKADFSSMSVFAITPNRDIMLIDGWIGKVQFNVALNKMFEIAHQYRKNLMGVGVEISAQQKTFISTIQEKQIRENRYFTLLSKKGNSDLGIAPTTNKFIRFKEIQPLFAAHKIWVPTEMKNEPYMNEFLNELRGVSKTNANPKKLGTALHDDILDNFSMLGMIDIICPSEDQGNMIEYDDGVYHSDVESDSGNDSYSC